MKLPRPHIPFDTRIEVAQCQLRGFGFVPIRRGSERKEVYLDHLLAVLATFLDPSAPLFTPLHLDHDPPLATREKIRRNGKVVRYKPDANDADFLIYRNADAHRTKTNVRGDGAQYPDRVLIKKIRRIERPKPKKKYNWPKRKLRWRDDHTKRNPSSQSRAVRISRSAHRHRAPNKSGHS